MDGRLVPEPKVYLQIVRRAGGERKLYARGTGECSEGTIADEIVCSDYISAEEDTSPFVRCQRLRSPFARCLALDLAVISSCNDHMAVRCICDGVLIEITILQRLYCRPERRRWCDAWVGNLKMRMQWIVGLS
jgi:hypothetical protein